jgi:excisionase family DNA binding protein
MPTAFKDMVLTIDDLAKYLKISKSTLYKLAQEGALPGQKVGRHWRFHREAVDDWLRNERQMGALHTNQHTPRNAR